VASTTRAAVDAVSTTANTLEGAAETVVSTGQAVFDATSHAIKEAGEKSATAIKTVYDNIATAQEPKITIIPLNTVIE